MGTAVPSEAQEGNKYILTLIMKAIVAYALAAFAAIAVNSIEATPLPSTDFLYEPAQNRPILARTMRSPLDLVIDPDTYVVLVRKMRHAEEFQPEEAQPQEARLTKREDLDTYLEADMYQVGYP